jgi:hypothetical protein
MERKMCSCEVYDPGDGENGPRLEVASVDEACEVHGRAAMPETWAESDRMDEGYEASRMGLSQDERDHLPGWLLKLLDGDNAYEIGYAARHSSARYYVQLLERRLAILAEDAAAAEANKAEADRRRAGYDEAQAEFVRAEKARRAAAAGPFSIEIEGMAVEELPLGKLRSIERVEPGLMGLVVRLTAETKEDLFRYVRLHWGDEEHAAQVVYGGDPPMPKHVTAPRRVTKPIEAVRPGERLAQGTMKWIEEAGAVWIVHLASGDRYVESKGAPVEVYEEVPVDDEIAEVADEAVRRGEARRSRVEVPATVLSEVLATVYDVMLDDVDDEDEVAQALAHDVALLNDLLPDDLRMPDLRERLETILKAYDRSGH